MVVSLEFSNKRERRIQASYPKEETIEQGYLKRKKTSYLFLPGVIPSIAGWFSMEGFLAEMTRASF